MQYTTIPNTDLEVSTICLGSTDIGSKIGRELSFRMLDAFFEGGGVFVDTASVYANWVADTENISEKTIGAWLRQSGKRDGMVLGTKGGHPNLDTMHVSRLSRREIEQDLDSSLKNLQTDVIDLYWLHRDDPHREVGEIMEVLNDQVKSGKIRYFGCSNWRAPRISAAQAYAAQHDLHGFCGDQMLWNLAVVDMDANPDKTIVGMDEELKRYHLESGLAAIPYSSQANGLFQKMAAGSMNTLSDPLQAMYRSAENERRFRRVAELANSLSVSITAIVLGYLQAQPFVTVPIVGCQNLAQLEDSMTAGDVRLTAEQVSYLEGSGASSSLG